MWKHLLTSLRPGHFCILEREIHLSRHIYVGYYCCATFTSYNRYSTYSRYTHYLPAGPQINFPPNGRTSRDTCDMVPAPYLAKLIARGGIPWHRLGRSPHYPILASSVLAGSDTQIYDKRTIQLLEGGYSRDRAWFCRGRECYQGTRHPLR